MAGIGRYIDLVGSEFNYWTVLERSGSKNGNALWLCRCICGSRRIISSIALRTKATSCGCKRGRHGHTGKDGKRSETYHSWQNMIARCTQPSNPSFLHYQAGGIMVCERWRIFDNFLADMGERPPGVRQYTLERIKNHLGYEPGNCRWATWVDQGNNRSTNVIFQFRGADVTLAQLARLTGVSKDLLRSRLCRCTPPWPIEEAVSVPPSRGRRRDREVR